MKRPILRRGLLVGLVCAGLSGCQHDTAQVVRKSKSESKPEDPTAWTGSEISKDDSASPLIRPKSSRLQGGWSDEAKSIEQSMGVGR